MVEQPRRNCSHRTMRKIHESCTAYSFAEGVLLTGAPTVFSSLDRTEKLQDSHLSPPSIILVRIGGREHTVHLSSMQKFFCEPMDYRMHRRLLKRNAKPGLFFPGWQTWSVGRLIIIIIGGA